MNNYDDIINLEHFEPKFHKRMNKLSRAAQFAPYAALNGYYDKIHETSRYVNKKIILTNEEKLLLNEKLINLNSSSSIKINYFIKDTKKIGGEYSKYIGGVKKVDSFNKILILNDLNVNFDDILDIEIIK